MEKALGVAAAGRENIPPKDLRTNTRPWLRLQHTAAAEETVPSCLNDASNQHANASSNAILFWRINQMMGSRTRITTTVFLSPLLPQHKTGCFQARLRCNDPMETRVQHGHDSTKKSLLPSQSTAKQLSAFCEIVHSLCLGKFGDEVKKKKSDALKQPNRQVKESQLRARQRWLGRQLKDAPQQEKIGIQVLLDGIKQEILDFFRAENHRKLRKKE